MKPVFVINGFMDSGKTSFIIDGLSRPDYPAKLKTLLIVCEQGEVEYDEILLREKNTILIPVEKKELLTASYFSILDALYKPAQILIEMNGLWNDLDLSFPEEWDLDRRIMIINTDTFPLYFTNMKQILTDIIRKSETIIFNRCDGLSKELLVKYKRNVKAVNQKTEYLFRDAEGDIRITGEEDLPYSINMPLITLKDNTSYGIWYLDAYEHDERYVGKKVSFTACVHKDKSLPSAYFIPGRTFMTCCAEDMQFLGYPCRFEQINDLKEDQWIELTATFSKEKLYKYAKEEIVLIADSIEKTTPPLHPVINFSL